MRKTLSMLALCASLVLVNGRTPAAERDPDPTLIASVRGCTQGDAAACQDLAQNLATRLEGAADGALELRLAMAAASAIEHPGRMVAGVAESCRVGYSRACVTLARVLDRLFTGDDARLERSTDRLLAHELAECVMAVVGKTASSKTALAGARPTR